MQSFNKLFFYVFTFRKKVIKEKMMKNKKILIA